MHLMSYGQKCVAVLLSQEEVDQLFINDFEPCIVVKRGEHALDWVIDFYESDCCEITIAPDDSMVDVTVQLSLEAMVDRDAKVLLDAQTIAGHRFLLGLKCKPWELIPVYGEPNRIVRTNSWSMDDA